jgi:hypothetical protein
MTEYIGFVLLAATTTIGLLVALIGVVIPLKRTQKLLSHTVRDLESLQDDIDSQERRIGTLYAEVNTLRRDIRFIAENSRRLIGWNITEPLPPGMMTKNVVMSRAEAEKLIEAVTLRKNKTSKVAKKDHAKS